MNSTITSLVSQITNIRAALKNMDVSAADYPVIERRLYNLAVALQIELDIRDFVAY